MAAVKNFGPLTPPARCYQGVIPAGITTCDRDGVPNVTYLSQVFRLDDNHVALSCQFFNKTKLNILANPRASVQLVDPLTFEAYQLDLRYERSETEGPLFDNMAMRIQAIASHTGMAGVFRLISADIFEVISCEKLDAYLIAEEGLPEPEALPAVRSELRALQLISQAMCRTSTLEELLSVVLDTIEQAFGFEYSMLLLPDETGQKLFTIASRGYEELGVGAEVAIGDGLIGTVAQQRRPLRIAGVDAELRYGRAIRGRVQQTSARRDLRPEIPLPGLADAESQLALPLVVGDRLLGVLAVESRERLGFDDWDEAFLEIVANQVAVGLDGVLMREASQDDGTARKPAAVAAAEKPPAARKEALRSRRFRFFRSDDCVFVDDEYLIRNVPGRILWKILRAHADTGRSDFSNRELRLDPSLGLPALRDNLESRLVLLRKRLEQKCPDLRLVSTSRGQFRLEASCALELEEQDGAS